MKVMMLVHGLAIGGAEIVASNLARFLRGRGIDVEFGCLDLVGSLGEKLRGDGFPVVCYNRRPGLDLALPLRIARHATRSSVDLVHAHQLTCYAYGVLAKLFSPRPIVFTEHGRFHPDFSTPRRRLFNRVFSRLVDHTTAVSDSVKESLASIEHFNRETIEVIRNAVDIERFSIPLSRRDARVNNGLPSSGAVVGTIGRLCAEKNYSLLIRAIAILREELPDISLVIVGDGPERQGLELLARELGISDRVFFLGQRTDIEQILPAFDVFALSSSTEGVPMTVLEAMAASKAIIATAVGGIPEILTDGEDARLVPMTAGDPASKEMAGGFAAALRELLGDERLRRAFGASACERARRDFSPEVVFGRYQAIYRALLHDHSA